MRILVAWLFLASAAFADVVHMKDGRKIEGKVTDLGDKIKIERGGVAMTVNKSDVERIEVKEYKEPEKKTVAPTKSRPRYKVRLTNTMTSVDGHFFVFLPKGWGGNSPVIRGPIPGPDGLKMEWTVQDGDSRTVDEALEAMKKDFQSRFRDAAFAGEQSFNSGGRPIRQFELTGTEGGKKITLLVQLMKNDATLIAFSFAAEEAVFDKRWHEANTLMRSVRWLKRVALTREQKDRFLDLYEKGYAELAAGRGEDALKTYKEAETILPDLPVIHSAKAHAYLVLKDYRAAVVGFQNALKLEPENVVDLWELALAYYYWGKEEEAIGAFKRVMEVDPENEEAFANCGILYANKEKWWDAKDAFKRGALKNPESVGLHLYWAQAAERCEKFAEAKEVYGKVLKLDPQNAEARKRLEDLKKK